MHQEHRVCFVIYGQTLRGASMSETILKIENASRIYNPGLNEVRAMDHVDLKVHKGAFMALVGPSGSGKSTLLNCMGCLDTLTSGHIYIEGIDTTNLNPDARGRIRADSVGFIFQSFNLVPVLTAFENIALSLDIQGKLDASDTKARVMTALERMGLADMAERKPAELSGGQQQRVAIARALVKEPAIILADEPTANLDRKTSEEIIALMRRMNEDLNATFVFSTHDEHLMEHARRVVHLEDGRITDDSQDLEQRS